MVVSHSTYERVPEVMIAFFKTSARRVRVSIKVHNVSIYLGCAYRNFQLRSR